MSIFNRHSKRNAENEKNYRAVTATDPAGKSKAEYIYIGPLSRWTCDEKTFKCSSIKIALLCLAALLSYITALTSNCAVNRSAIAGIPSLCSVVPLCVVAYGCIQLFTSYGEKRKKWFDSMVSKIVDFGTAAELLLIIAAIAGVTIIYGMKTLQGVHAILLYLISAAILEFLRRQVRKLPRESYRLTEEE